MKQLDINAMNPEPLCIGTAGIAHNVHRHFLIGTECAVEQIPCFGHCEVAVIKETEIALIGNGIIDDLETEWKLRLFIVSRIGIDPRGAIT